MAAAIALRRDYDAYRLRVLAKQSDDADQTRRLLALATIYDGGSRGDAAELAGVGLQTLRDWVLRFNAAGPSGLLNGKAPGRQPLLDDRQRRELAPDGLSQAVGASAPSRAGPGGGRRF